MQEALELLKALADETRLRLVKALSDKEFCVCELADALEVSQSNLSRHLTVLKRAGLLSDRKDGTWVYYTVTEQAKPKLERLFEVLQRIDSPRTQLDADRLQKRLTMRTGAKCLRGYGELPPSAKGGR